MHIFTFVLQNCEAFHMQNPGPNLKRAPSYQHRDLPAAHTLEVETLPLSGWFRKNSPVLRFHFSLMLGTKTFEIIYCSSWFPSASGSHTAGWGEVHES